MCIFFIILVYSANFFSFWSKYIEQDCQNWNLRVHRKSWKKIKFFEKIVGVLIIFFRNDQKSFKFWRRLVGRVVNTAFDVGIGWFWEVLFAHWANLFRHSVEVFPAGLSEEPSKFLTIFGYWAQAFRLFFRKTSYRAARTEFYLFTGTDWKKKFLERASGTVFIFFGHWAKVFLAFYQLFFGSGCQKCILCVNRNTSAEKFL